MARNKIIRNPILNAYMYDVCFNLTEEVKRKLPLPYIKVLSSPIRIKNFCEFSSIDTKLRFFHAIGLNNALTVFPDKAKNGKEIQQLILKYDDEKLAAGIKGSVGMNVFVTSDKQTAFLVNLMAQTIHTESYALNLDYNKTGYHIKKWSKKIDTSSQRDLEECEDSAKAIIKNFLEASLCLRSSEVLFGMKDVDLNVLMYFYEKMHVYLERDTVYLKFDIHYQKRYITMSIKRLTSEGFLTKHPTDMRYTINSSGIDLVNRYLNRVIKANNF